MKLASTKKFPKSDRALSVRYSKPDTNVTERDQKIVAVKKVLMDNDQEEEFYVKALREIRILQLLKHENVVNLLEICRSQSPVINRFKTLFYLVSDFCEHDLAGLLSNPTVQFSLGEIKKMMQQLLNGLDFLHSNQILHCDMKASNVMITKSGILKLAGFGLARPFNSLNQPNSYSNRVVTLWYRPPELLLGERNYGPSIDMWGAGCIMAEMWTRRPIMQGKTEQHQLTLICQLCGSITPEVWPSVEKLYLFNKMELVQGQKRRVKEYLELYVNDPNGCDLLDTLLTLDPSKRIDANAALDHLFFKTDPMPCDLSKMLGQHDEQSMSGFLAPQLPGRDGQPLETVPPPNPYPPTDSETITEIEYIR